MVEGWHVRELNDKQTDKEYILERKDSLGQREPKGFQETLGLPQ